MPKKLDNPPGIVEVGSFVIMPALSAEFEGGEGVRVDFASTKTMEITDDCPNRDKQVAPRVALFFGHNHREVILFIYLVRSYFSHAQLIIPFSLMGDLDGARSSHQATVELFEEYATKLGHTTESLRSLILTALLTT